MRCLGSCLWLLLVTFLTSVSYARTNEECTNGVRTGGVTYPRGVIEVENGTRFEILCVIDPNFLIGYNASDIRFYQSDRSRGKMVPVPEDSVSVVNETTARLVVEAEDPVDFMHYFCKVRQPEGNETTLCLNKVVVGFPPQPISNFTCRSRSLLSLNCTWPVPWNPIRTDYKLCFRLGSNLSPTNRFCCPDSASPNFGHCYWDSHTNPVYRNLHPTYYFTFEAKNRFGNVTFPEIKFNHFEHVVPSAPEYLNGSHVTTNSVLLHWGIEPQLESLNLRYRIKYKTASECDPPDEWRTVDNVQLARGRRSLSFNLTGLPYANCLYDVRLYARTSEARSEDMWSKPAAYTFKTAPIPPARPPAMDPGGYYVIGRKDWRDVTVFWQRLRRCEENGDDFRYEAYAVADEDGRILKPTVVGKSYARFDQLTLGVYHVFVESVNKEGRSLPGQIQIPAKDKAPPPPTGLTKYVLGSGEIKLTWKNTPVEGWAGKIDSYTVFRCQNDRYGENHCIGVLNWTRFPVETNETLLTQFKHGELGVAANAGPISSGIAWASCTIRPNNDFGQLQNIRPHGTGSTFIEVAFRVDCVDRLSSIPRYLIHYCPIASPGNPVCRERGKNVTVNTYDSDVVVNITGLSPYTTYLMYVVPVAKDGKPLAEKSAPVYSTTLDGQPSPPRNVTVYKVGSDSLTVRWLPPLVMNGKLNSYLVHYNGQSKRVDPNGPTEVVLKNLNSVTVYNVTVEACTVQCTSAEEVVEVETLLGVPKVVRSYQQNNTLVIKWVPPPGACGPEISYEAMLSLPSDRVYSSRVIALKPAMNETRTSDCHLTPLTASVPVAECHGAEVLYAVFVRAVRSGSAASEWSESRDVFCQSADGGISRTAVVVWCVVTLSVLLAVAAVVWRVARWCCVAHVVEVKLPPGLEPVSVKEGKDETFLRSPWRLYGGSGKSKAASQEEATLLRGSGAPAVARCDSGGSASSDGALSALTSATAVSDCEDGDQPRARRAPAPARQWSTFSDSSGSTVSRSAPNLPELLEYCRAGGGARRGSLDAGYTHMGVTGGELMAASELSAATPKTPPPLPPLPTSKGNGGFRAVIVNWPREEPAAEPNRHQQQAGVWPPSRGYVAVDSLPEASNRQATPQGYVVASQLRQLSPQGYVMASQPQQTAAQGHVLAGQPEHKTPKGYMVASQPQQTTPQGYVTATQPLQTNPQGYVLANQLQHTTPQGYVVASRPHQTSQQGLNLPQQSAPQGSAAYSQPQQTTPQGYVLAGHPVQQESQQPAMKGPSTAYVVLGEGPAGQVLRPLSSIHQQTPPVASRGYVSLQQLEKT